MIQMEVLTMHVMGTLMQKVKVLATYDQWYIPVDVFHTNEGEAQYINNQRGGGSCPN